MTHVERWPEADTARLRQLAQAGYTCTQIARQIGRTRNAVLDRAYRLGVTIGGIASREQKGSATKSAQRVAKNKPARAAQSKPAPPVRSAPVPVPTGDWGTGTPLIELEAGCCRWPTGERTRDGWREHLFCAAPVMPDAPYCPEHQKRARVRAPDHAGA